MDDVFYVAWDAREDGKSFDAVTEKTSTQLEELKFDDLRNYIIDALTPPKVTERYTSRMPKIYGIAAETEALALKRRSALMEKLARESGSFGADQLSNDPVFLASQLEFVAAELASATARLVQIERVYATAESCGVESLWDVNVDAVGSSDDECLIIEGERADARAMFERKLAAIEAALAARDRARRDITQSIEKPQMSILSKSRQPLDEQNTRVASKGVIQLENAAPSSPLTSPLARPLPSTPCGNGRELILQGFNWESCNHETKNGESWYQRLLKQIPDIAAAGFTSVWMPPATKSVSKQGYLPTDLYNLDSFYGSESDLRSCVARMREYNITPVADIVINHRCAEAQDDAGRWNVYTGKIAWDARAITSENAEYGGKGNRGTGEDYIPAPNIDHTQEFVRKDLKEWLLWLREDVGFRGWRFDFVKGYSGVFTGEYVDATRPFLSFGEFWDACAYRDGVLEYNQDGHRQRTCDWVDSTGGNTAAFDFTTKGILQEAVARTEYWRLIDSKGKPPGFLGMWPSRAVTFIENHDTGSTLQHWPFPWKKALQGYCYILTHPGTPTVFYDHWVDPLFKDSIDKMLSIRRRVGISSNKAAVHIERATEGCYAAHIGHATELLAAGLSTDVDVSKASICMKLGKEDWSPNATKVANLTWKCTASGDGWAIWEDARSLVSVDDDADEAASAR
jgi:alpha-amylase